MATVRDQDEIAIEAARWHARLASGAVAAADRTAFAAWRAADPRHAAAAAEMAALWHEAGVAAPARRRWQRRSLVAGGAVLAAAAAGLAWGPLLVDDLTADAVTAVGERRALTLPGGIDVTLNTDTAFSRAEDGRLSLARGEVMIVSKPAVAAREDRLAATARMTIRFGQAAFALAAGGPRSGVQVLEGAVDAMAGPDAPAVQVRAGQRLRIGAAEPDMADPLDLAWRQGVLAFRNRPLGSVAAELDTYRHGRIVILSAALRARRVSGSLSLGRADDAVTALAALLSLQMRVLPPGIIFLSES